MLRVWIIALRFTAQTFAETDIVLGAPFPLSTGACRVAWDLPERFFLILLQRISQLVYGVR